MGTAHYKAVTADHIAAKLKLSPTTVSLVLNGRGRVHRISERTAQRVLAAAREMDYRPNVVARQLAGKRSNAVGVLISTEAIADARLIQAMEIRAAERGIRFIVGHAVGTREGVLNYLGDFRARGVDGVVSIFHNHPDYSGIVEPELQKFRNVVFYERPGDWTGAGKESPCYVEPDFYQVGRMGVRHLLDRGRRRIAMAFSNLAYPYARQRRRAYGDALREAGLSVDDRLVWILPERTGARWMDAFTPELAQKAVADLVVAAGADAIVAVNDLYAARLISALRQRGLRVPHDVAVIGCDNQEIGTLVDPALTTIDLRLERLASAMTDLLLELLEKGTVPPDRRAVVVPPELIVRASS